MNLLSKGKDVANLLLSPFNLRLETRTFENQEHKRLMNLERQGHFQKPVFPVSSIMNQCNYEAILTNVLRYTDCFENFQQQTKNQVNYTYNNHYFTSPDTEVLYTIVRTYKPNNIIEVGSGNSTRVIRQAILDGNLDTSVISIDPCPRLEIREYVDEVMEIKVEELENRAKLLNLLPNDILFIDSSHRVDIGNDVELLYGSIIPSLNKGVLVHIHDIFLPYQYPFEWVAINRWGFNEQLLVQVLLANSNNFEVLWPGYYLQRNERNFYHYFPRAKERRAQSLWLRKL